MKVKRWQASGMLALYVLWMLCAGSSGCMNEKGAYVQHESPIPRELRMTTLPPYVIEPPDILLVTVLRAVPKPPYHLRPLDAVYITVNNTPEGSPIKGMYGIEPDGTVNLGMNYGTFRVVDMTIPQAQAALQKFLVEQVKLRDPNVLVSLAQSRGVQQITGIHLVRNDGTIGLGTYGSVYITAMTIDQARKTLEQHLSNFLQDPEISIDVFSYNSKWYYIIADRMGYGEQIIRMPITGRDTVLDAVSNIFGIPFFGSKHHIWIARPNGRDPNCQQIFPVDWIALTKGGSPATNYQLLPGDRLYIASNPLLLANNRLNQFLQPLERVFGFTLLGTSVVSSINSLVRIMSTPIGQNTGFIATTP